MKHVIILVVLLAAIVPLTPVSAAIDLGKVAAGIQVINAIKGVSDKEVNSICIKLDEGLVKEYGTTDKGLGRVQKVVHKIAPNDKNDICVLSSNELNAMSIPGHLYITDSLLSKLSEDQLAGVMAHEIAHQKNGDTKAAIKRGKIAQGLGGALALANSKSNVVTGVTIAAAVSSLKYSRDQEYRADADGAKYAYEAGYDPNGLTNALRKLESGKKTIEFLSDHPDTDKRISRLTDETAQWGKVGEVKASTNNVSRSTGQRHKNFGAVVVKVIDHCGGGYGFFRNSNSTDAITTAMETALADTGYFTVPDPRNRQLAWDEQDLNDSGRMDSATMPRKGKTVGSKYFVIVELSSYSVQNAGKVRIGDWSNRGEGSLMIATIKGKVKFESAEKTVVKFATDFKGSDKGYETSVSISGHGRGNIDLEWLSQPAGKAVTKACNDVAKDIVGYVLSNDETEEFATASGDLVLVPEKGKRISITVNAKKTVSVGDEIAFYSNDKVIAKYKVMAISGIYLTVKTVVEKVRPTDEPFRIIY